MGMLDDIVAGAGQTIVVETELLGPRVIAVKDGVPSPLVGFVRPKITVIGPGGVTLASVAPYGEPDSKARMAKQVLIATAVAGVIVGAFWIGRKSR